MDVTLCQLPHYHPGKFPVLSPLFSQRCSSKRVDSRPPIPRCKEPALPCTPPGVSEPFQSVCILDMLHQAHQWHIVRLDRHHRLSNTLGCHCPRDKRLGSKGRVSNYPFVHLAELGQNQIHSAPGWSLDVVFFLYANETVVNTCPL